MAFYSIYTGFIYNEFFSMPMAIFGPTHWKCTDHTGAIMAQDPRNCQIAGGEMTWVYNAVPYNLGIDPIWHGRNTELPYLNSVKMKMSILLGVTHMDFGILMSLFNNLYFR